jgi:cation diffusion facilitator family transporter
MMNQNEAKKTVLFSLMANAFLAGAKFTVGILGNSFAVIADAIESTADIFSSFVVFLGLKISTKPSDEKHPYGHGKIEPLITFIVVAFLAFSSFIIALEAIKNIRTPHEMPKSFTLIFLVLVILFKELSFQYVNKKGKKLNSTSIKADAWHHRSDAITSVAAFIGICIALIGGKGWENADDWAALVASGLILYNAYLIFRPALGELLDEQKYDDLIQGIKAAALEVSGVENTEKCYIRKFGMSYFVDIHVRVNRHISVEQGHNIAHNLKNHLVDRFPYIEGVMTHVEPMIDAPSLVP